MSDAVCPFCAPAADRVFYQGNRVIGLWDAFPVSPGHALLVTRRHVATWWDATTEEQREIVDALGLVKSAIIAAHAPDGFNIGMNVGRAAGQTVFHLHVHIIPRYGGDVPDPRGGVRHIIPTKGNYLVGRSSGATAAVPHLSGLVHGDDDPLLPHLLGHADAAHQIDVAVAFVLSSGLDRLDEHFRDLLERGGRIRFLTGDYLNVTEPTALHRLLDVEANSQGRLQLRVFETGRYGGSRSFHPKSYIFRQVDGTGVAFVGSSNLTHVALSNGVEWNYRVVSSNDAAGFQDVVCSFERLFNHPATVQLTSEWVRGYQSRRAVASPTSGALPALEPVEIAPEKPLDYSPHDVQQEALEALDATRADGNTAGLVVLATGLGKTWLSAFDSNRPKYKRVLFVAHREEILAQAMSTYRKIRPYATFGLYTGIEKTPDADVLFASIQTLGRNRHLDRFAPDEFDYIVVDEFHHAAAPSYRRLIERFQPRFLLGLTATPERTDGGDLLALCQENLVYRCDVVDGIRRGLLCPFHYFGVPDEVDYTNIPWRNSRFDEEELTRAVATQTRAENALEQYRLHGGRRTLAFCVSQRHADFMADFFGRRNVKAVAVHAGQSSAPRAASLEMLAAGRLDVVFAVDMFNEGVDLPALDTVMMLRPTESRILWLQQFGRGLRIAEGKQHLSVVDYIGNHRTFLLKPQTLLALGSAPHEVYQALERIQRGEADLPPGCEVTYDLKAVEILRGLIKLDGGDALRDRYREFRELHAVRPTASEMYHEGYNPRSARRLYGSWLGFVRAQGDLDFAHDQAFERSRYFLEAIETTEMTKGHKMLTLLAMLNADRFPGEIRIEDLVTGFKRLAMRAPRLTRDCGDALADDQALRRVLETNPIAAWVGAKGTGGIPYFAYQDGVFRTTPNLTTDNREALQELVREVGEWRLAEYLDRRGDEDDQESAGDILCKVSHSGPRPILFLPDRRRRSDIPEGTTAIMADGEAYEADFAQVAVNVVRRTGADENELPRLLRGWFGPDAGRPGTNQRVVFQQRATGLHLFPLAKRPDERRLWDSYSREQIPGLFGLEFSRAIWNAGFVSASGHMFLLVTLQKHGKDPRFQYADRFLAPDRFEWQSQNRTTQASKHGQDISHHSERGIAVHLFVRSAGKTPQGRSSPFVYCGEVTFASWHGEAPITVDWKLSRPLPAALWNTMGFHPDR